MRESTKGVLNPQDIVAMVYFTIGGGVGVQVKKPPDLAFGVGEDLFIAMNVDGPVLPRFAFNLGYAF